MAASTITYPNKNTGDQYLATEANEVKTVVNAHATNLDTVITGGTIGQYLKKTSGVDGAFTWTDFDDAIIIAASDETTDLTTGTSKVTIPIPRQYTLTGVKANVNTAPTGATITVDINKNAATILSTKLTIDIGETTSTSAAVPPVISDTALVLDDLISIDIDQIGSTVAGTGLKITLLVNRTS